MVLCTDNARIIKNYSMNDTNVTLDYIYDIDEWDLIECNINLDPEKLKKYHDEFIKQYDYLRFFFNGYAEKLNKQESIRLVQEEGKCGIDCGPISGFTLSWPIERYEPLPPPSQLNLEMYPEVKYETFMDDSKILEKFKFGYLIDLINILGVDALQQLVMVTHNPGMTIGQHIDRKDPLKLHIPIITNNNAFFLFGKNKERSYHMKVGKVYVLNTGIYHGTINPTGVRTHFITRIKKDHLMNVISL
jgi:hypothetical protein